ncbi:MAG: polyphenol oxidase family protein [bacterium]|nr:polyphenol oxidase family protein [bacterium]
MTQESPLRHPLIDTLGVAHGFGTRTSVQPPDILRPVQVHGIAVMRVGRGGDTTTREADAIVCDVAGQSIGILTADCVPILACSESGAAVAAIHAGWRGLAAGVVEAGIEALRGLSPQGDGLFAVIGPHIGACCYEVDSPVLDAMTGRFGAGLVQEASSTTREGHAKLDLARLVEVALDRSGVAQARRARFEDDCTSCDAVRFHSYRRAGEAAGRMTHFIVSNGL